MRAPDAFLFGVLLGGVVAVIALGGYVVWFKLGLLN